MKHKSCCAAVAVVAACFLASCASPASKTAEAKKPYPEDTERYTPVGSHVSKRVKKPVKAPVGEENAGEILVRDMQSYGRISDQNEGSNARIKRD